MSLWIRCRAIALCTLPIIIAACSDSTVAPKLNTRIAGQSADAVSSSGNGVQLHSNESKYRDAGYKPATGRSGSASIMMRALERKDGSMFVDVTTGDFDVPGSAAGYMSKLQAKVFTHDAKVSTKNYNGIDVSAYTFAPFRAERGSVVQLQANVRGKDTPRTDVVTAQDTVRLGADIAVDHVTAPYQVRPNDVYTVDAVLTERNGDIGGRTDAVLYVNGARTDVATRVWVDAGGQVSVAFAVRAGANPETDQLTVKLENLLPFDYDPSNNTGSAQVIVGPATMLYRATAFEHAGTYYNNYTYNYVQDPFAPYQSTFEKDYNEVVRTQETHVYAWIENGIAFPVASATAKLSTDGTQLDAVSLTNFAATSSFGTPANGGQCGTSVNNGSTVIVCTNHVGTATWASFTYDRYAGSVTYVTTQWSSYLAPWGSGWYYNQDPAVTALAAGAGAPITAPFGATVAFQLGMQSGAANYVANPVIQLTPNPYTQSNAFCNSFRNDANIGTITECYNIGGSYLDKEGFVWAPGL